MPDPLLYVQVAIVALSASALGVFVCAMLALGWRWRPPSVPFVSSLCVAGVAFGMVAGCYWLRLPIGWPPASALDRFLVVLLPAVLLVELVATLPQVRPWGANSLRCVLAVSLARVLLHRSVYLDEWTTWQTLMALAVCAVLPILAWLLLIRLAERAPGVSLPLALALVIQSAGVAIMLAGYLRGGTVAIVVATTMLGASLACALVAKNASLQALVGFGVVSLSSLLLIGIFFGRLPVTSALVLLAAPLAGWLTELGWCRQRSAWAVGTIRLAIVAAVVAIVLLIALRKFDREFRPLLYDAVQSSQDVPASTAQRDNRVLRLRSTSQHRDTQHVAYDARFLVIHGSCGLLRPEVLDCSSSAFSSATTSGRATDRFCVSPGSVSRL